jgi:E3 ubiquitin-protein ligase DOA10
LFSYFHPDCVKEWFKEKNVCPICKSELTDEKVYEPEGKKETPGK